MTKQEAAPDMEQCMFNAKPSDGHKALEVFKGTWDAHVKFWMDPSAPPDESDGVMTNTWVLGGRYLEQSYKGMTFGSQFEGRGYFGFNNGSRKYEGFWIDTASTCMSHEVGAYDAASKTWTMIGSFANPADGSEGTKRTTFKIKSPDEHIMESFFPGPGGKEIKMMEIVYKRKK
jgi:hypothetical protein